VETTQIASQRTFPEKVGEFMKAGLGVAVAAEQIQGAAFE
jgi:hypothetical protein